MLRATTEILRDLIAFPTVSSDSNLEMIAYIAQRLEVCNADVHLFTDPSGQKANLFATLGPPVDGGIVLSGHSDVVPVKDQDWTSDPFAMIERDGKLFGRGSCDMKGFIAATLAMAPRFAAAPLTRPLHFAFTYDEEVGCIGAGHLAASLEQMGVRPGVAIIGEPTEMRIIEGHKGCYEYTTRFQGLEGHGSAPDLGVNAVEYAVQYVARLLELKSQLRCMAPDGSPFDPPWTTVNVGAFSGGTVHNVIASKAQVDWEMRPVQNSDADFVKSDLNALCNDVLLPKMRDVFPEASIETEVVGEVDGLLPTPENEARRIVFELTGRNDAGVVPFGSEAGIFQKIGMDIVVCGPGSIEQAHKADEYVAIDQLNQCGKMLERLSAKLQP
ncbi:acetylornithine deacetylase [uncultured Ruegeria sp.]|uniref:acetylornithine deacetylase n=1 Tax=uncultured Ruegeria sp. TaxID=259304 RepID=UPI0026210EA5|nr:acetylornithine deacetylase [uncultured Ruegeria sp.]